MAYILKVRKQGAYLHVKVEGDNTARDIAGYLAEIPQKCEKYKCPNVLIEENLEGPSPVFSEIYQIVNRACRDASAAVRQIAYVDINPRQNKEINRFAETLALNRGVNIKLFETVREARNWLRKTILLPSRHSKDKTTAAPPEAPGFE